MIGFMLGAICTLVSLSVLANKKPETAAKLLVSIWNMLERWRIQGEKKKGP